MTGLFRLANVLPAYQHGSYSLLCSLPGGPIEEDRMMGRSAEAQAKGQASRREACCSTTAEDE